MVLVLFQVFAGVVATTPTPTLHISAVIHSPLVVAVVVIIVPIIPGDPLTLSRFCDNNDRTEPIRSQAQISVCASPCSAAASQTSSISLTRSDVLINLQERVLETTFYKLGGPSSHVPFKKKNPEWVGRGSHTFRSKEGRCGGGSDTDAAGKQHHRCTPTKQGSV
eukprot:m.149968 g.149968  ORF g.149968 m.149968 type:complete len:165 (-) comp23275_c0_seq7:58-552(-)